jgi:hypothetical protein
LAHKNKIKRKNKQRIHILLIHFILSYDLADLQVTALKKTNKKYSGTYNTNNLFYFVLQLSRSGDAKETATLYLVHFDSFLIRVQQKACKII